MIPDLADVRVVLRKWLDDAVARIERDGILAELSVGGEDLNKAVVTLEAPSHVATLTAWGRGTLELIVVDTRNGQDCEIIDSQYRDETDLLSQFDEALRRFERYTRGQKPGSY